MFFCLFRVIFNIFTTTLESFVQCRFAKRNALFKVTIHQLVTYVWFLVNEIISLEIVLLTDKLRVCDPPCLMPVGPSRLRFLGAVARSNFET